MPPSHREKLLATLTLEEKADLVYRWEFWARENQWPPSGDWRVWLILAGRGFGKTRTGAEWVRASVESGRRRRLALVGPTAADVRDVMVEGESGLLAVCPPPLRPYYEPTKRRLTWPNGAVATLYSADEPDRLRGPQHDGAWGDELAAWRRPEAWDMLLLGLRLGQDPQVVVTTTPRPTRIIRELKSEPSTVTTVGTSYENRANLAPAFYEAIVRRYEGTRLGRQELLAEILEDNPYALWQRDQIDNTRVDDHPDLVRVVVGLDPAVTANEDSDETGIVVAALGSDGEYYVLSDRSLRASPKGWASCAIRAYHAHQADRIIGETNNGGDMIEATLRAVDDQVAYTKVTATRGKQLRAEPIAALYEQKRVHHVGFFPELEEQMVEWVPGEASPDRLDALVWAMTELTASGYTPPVALMGAERDAGAFSWETTNARANAGNAPGWDPSGNWGFKRGGGW